MTDALRERAMDALSRVVPPGIDKSLVELGFVKSVEPSDDGVLTVSLGLRAPHVRHRSLIEKACREALAPLPMSEARDYLEKLAGKLAVTTA